MLGAVNGRVNDLAQEVGELKAAVEEFVGALSFLHGGMVELRQEMGSQQLEHAVVFRKVMDAVRNGETTVDLLDSEELVEELHATIALGQFLRWVATPLEGDPQKVVQFPNLGAQGEETRN